MSVIQFTLRVPVRFTKKDAYYVACCPVLDVCSQGRTETEAKKNIAEAIKLFLVTCYERGTLDTVMKECGFQPVSKGVHPPKDHKFVDVLIPFSAQGSCPVTCHA